MKRRVALIFPGQGSQFIGMGKELAKTFVVARETFEEIDEALGQNLSKLFFDGNQDELTLTFNAQPAIMGVSLAVFRTILNEGGFIDASGVCSVMAGHSLGEYSALCASGALGLPETAKLLRTRGNAMHEACNSSGGMVALLGISIEQAEKLAEFGQRYGICSIANDNSIDQVVVSGTNEAIDKILEKAPEYGARRAIKLNVGGPFHCMLMEEAARKMEIVLKQIPIGEPIVPIIANYSALPNQDPALIADLLVKQVSGRVRWRESIIHAIEKLEIDLFIEVGPEKVLGRLIKKSNPEIEVVSVSKPDEINMVLELLTK